MSALSFLGALINPITSAYQSYLGRKTAKDGLKSKAVMARQSDSTQITLTDAEWELASKQLEDNSWKDEYVTLVITSPIVGILGGAVYHSFTGDPRLLEGVMSGIQAIGSLDINVGLLMEIVVLAAVGLKVWRKA